MRFDGLKITALALLVLTVGVVSAGDDVLYWMVDGNANVTIPDSGATVTIGEFFNNINAYYPWELNTGDGSAFAARVRVTGGKIQDGQDVFLDLYVPEYGIVAGSGEYGVEFGDGSGYWGAGVPTGNQSPSGDYSAGTPEYSFIVELGNIDAQDNWTTVATSASAAYSTLGDFIHETFDINPGQNAVWSPATFTAAVPEPSSGLLMAVGLALLALRRKRTEREA